MSRAGRDPQGTQSPTSGSIVFLNQLKWTCFVNQHSKRLSHCDVVFKYVAIIKVLKIWSKDGNRSQDNQLFSGSQALHTESALKS